jgi:hypothetical protein
LSFHSQSKNLELKKYKTIILPVILYGCETWEENILRVFGNRMLRRIFGPKREEVMGGWRKVHTEELHNVYCSPITIKVIRLRRMR